MTVRGIFASSLLVICLSLAACSASAPELSSSGDDVLAGMLISEADDTGWKITPDDGPVDGNTTDCTGAKYEWPNRDTLAHASQFLDRDGETVALVVKRSDGAAKNAIDALRGALAPCATTTGELFQHGAMIDLVGDDSFAYQTQGTDDRGDFVFGNMLVSCGDLILEALTQSYTGELDQSGLEALVAPVVARMEHDTNCQG